MTWSNIRTAARRNERLVIVCLLSLLSARVDAQTADIEILPSNPTPASNISIKLTGTWMDSCVPQSPVVFISGNVIYIDTSNPGEVCAQFMVDWSLTVPIGRLKSGTYTVVASFESQELGRKTFGVSVGPVDAYIKQSGPDLVQIGISMPDRPDNFPITFFATTVSGNPGWFTGRFNTAPGWQSASNWDAATGSLTMILSNDLGRSTTGPIVSLVMPPVSQTIRMSGTNLSDAEFNEYDVSCGTTPCSLWFVAGAHVVFLGQPGSAVAGQEFGSAPELAVKDGAGNVVPIVSAEGFTGPTVALKSGTGTDGAILTGTNEYYLTEKGTAIFPNLSIDKPGIEYVITGTVGILPQTDSLPFDVIAVQVPTKLAFSVQPAGAIAGLPFAVQPVIEAQDGYDKPVSSYSGTVVMAIKEGTGNPNAVLSGSIIVNAVK